MKVFYDTEFLEDGKTIELISIGMVAENGTTYQAYNSEMPTERIKNHHWLMGNVVPHLPLVNGVGEIDGKKYFTLDYKDVNVKPRWVIANEVRTWLRSFDSLELWAYYCSYDHVALAQMFGPMVNLPMGIPMFTNDLRQLIGLVGKVTGLSKQQLMPKYPDHVEHDALSDARQVMMHYNHLRTVLADYPSTSVSRLL